MIGTNARAGRAPYSDMERYVLSSFDFFSHRVLFLCSSYCSLADGLFRTFISKQLFIIGCSISSRDSHLGSAMLSSVCMEVVTSTIPQYRGFQCIYDLL